MLGRIELYNNTKCGKRIFIENPKVWIFCSRFYACPCVTTLLSMKQKYLFHLFPWWVPWSLQPAKTRWNDGCRFTVQFVALHWWLQICYSAMTMCSILVGCGNVKDTMGNRLADVNIIVVFSFKYFVCSKWMGEMGLGFSKVQHYYQWKCYMKVCNIH